MDDSRNVAAVGELSFAYHAAGPPSHTRSANGNPSPSRFGSALRTLTGGLRASDVVKAVVSQRLGQGMRVPQRARTESTRRHRGWSDSLPTTLVTSLAGHPGRWRPSLAVTRPEQKDNCDTCHQKVLPREVTVTCPIAREPGHAVRAQRADDSAAETLSHDLAHFDVRVGVVQSQSVVHP